MTSSNLGRNLATPAVALAIAAHPDDVEFECGATLAKWAASGCEVHHLICTDGSKGTWDVNADTEELVATRQREQRDAAAALGATGEVHFLGRVDGELVADLEARADVTRVIREVKPTVVLGHDPWKRYRLHPDHRAAGWLAIDGVVAARDPHFFGELGPHHRPDALLLFEAQEHNHLEEVAGFDDIKASALLAHTSQFLTTMEIDDPNDEDQRDAFRQRVIDKVTADGQSVGAGPAELFQIISPL